MPTNWIRLPYQSDQKYGTVPVGRGCAWIDRVPTRDSALLGGDRPVLEAHPGVKDRVGPAGEIARGIDTRRAGLQRLVALDSVAELEPGGDEPVGRRRDADADHDEVGLDPGAVGEAYGLDLIDRLRSPRHLRRSEGVVPFRSCRLARTSAHLLTDRSRERRRHCLDDGHGRAALAGRRGDLRADEAGTDDDGSGAGIEGGRGSSRASSRLRSVWTPGQVLSAGQGPRRRAGREHQRGVGQRIVADPRPPARRCRDRSR